MGFIIEEGHIRKDPEKVKVVSEWPVPLNQKKFQQFLGFANFYRWFIRNFSQTASPLTSLTSPLTSLTYPKVNLSWSPEANRLSSPATFPRPSGTMMRATGSYWPSSRLWRSGNIGLRGQSTCSSCGPTTKILNPSILPSNSTPAKPVGLCFAPVSISKSPTAREVRMSQLVMLELTALGYW